MDKAGLLVHPWRFTIHLPGETPVVVGSRVAGNRIAVQGRSRDALLAIDTPVVDSEGSLEFEVGFADIGPPPASETLKPLVSAILSEAIVGTLGPSGTGVCFSSISACGNAPRIGGSW